MLDSIYHRTDELLKNPFSDVKTSGFCHSLRNVIGSIPLNINEV